MVMTVDGSEATGWRPGEPAALLAGPSIEIEPAFSPDGRWLAYTSNESGRFEVYVQSFPEFTERVVVSANGGRHPQWSRTANRLFFVDSSSGPCPILFVDYAVENGAFVPTPPRPWTTRRVLPRRLGLNYALHPDGTRVVAHVDPESPEVATTSDRLVFVTNFFDELRRLAPPTR